jgi:citrate lyase subunit beta/citryl-CoA lyase
MYPNDAVQTASSFLFVPGDRPERFHKAAAAGADVVIVDLEDAVADDHKSAARVAVVAWLSGCGRACVRINSAASPHQQRDLDALTGLPGLIGVMVPKADDPSLLTAVAEQTGAPVVALVESAVGIVQARAIATAPGVARLAFGHLDYALDIGAEPSWTAMLQARATLVLMSRVAGLPGPIDGVTTSIEDHDALARDLGHAKEIGMTGKLLVHPGQVPGARAGFQPDDEAIRWARRIVESASAGEAVRVDGQMVDAPVLARAHAMLRQSD